MGRHFHRPNESLTLETNANHRPAGKTPLTPLLNTHAMVFKAPVAPKTPVEHTHPKRKWPPQNESKWSKKGSQWRRVVCWGCFVKFWTILTSPILTVSALLVLRGNAFFPVQFKMEPNCITNSLAPLLSSWARKRRRSKRTRTTIGITAPKVAGRLKRWSLIRAAETKWRTIGGEFKWKNRTLVTSPRIKNTPGGRWI